LATVADTSRMWALLEVREADAAALRPGQAVTIRVDGMPREFAGTVTWIASEFDPKTRTVETRAEIANHEGLLRAEQFARATVRVGASKDALIVPQQAVQRVGEEPVLFVRTGEGLYEPRLVTLGRSVAGLIEVHGALREGDPVVTEGAFLLRTELSRESIGAGCCEVVRPGGS
jgi:cobalt-zinc-cadmium efflux system membrane fusion protein